MADLDLFKNEWFEYMSAKQENERMVTHAEGCHAWGSAHYECALRRIAELEALCLNALYHHQGASSAVGQPIRKALGMGEFDRLTEAQLKIIHNVRLPYATIAGEATEQPLKSGGLANE